MNQLLVTLTLAANCTTSRLFLLIFCIGLLIELNITKSTSFVIISANDTTNTYCTNIYGSPLWKHFDRKLLEPFYIAWRKCIRRVWKIPYTSHNVLIQYIHNTI